MPRTTTGALLSAKRAAVATIAVLLAGSLGAGWFASALESALPGVPGAGGPWGWVVGGLVLGVVAIVVAASLIPAESPRLRRTLYLALPNVLLLPIGLAWFGDGVLHGTWVLMAWGGGVTLATFVLLLLAYANRPVTIPRRPVPGSAVLDSSRLARARVLIASVGPLGPGERPKALFHSLHHMPNLELVLQVDDGSIGLEGLIPSYLTLLKRPPGTVIVKRVNPLVPGDFTASEESNLASLSFLLGQIDEVGATASEILVDVTGGRVPQSITLYAMALRAGWESVYVVEPHEGKASGLNEYEFKDAVAQMLAKQPGSDTSGLRFARLTPVATPTSTRPLILLNTTLLTAQGTFQYEPVDVEGARALVMARGGVHSAIGHPPTADLVSDLLGIEVPVARVSVVQEVGQQALVFKLEGGRLPEGAVLDRAQIEERGYQLGLLTRLR